MRVKQLVLLFIFLTSFAHSAFAQWDPQVSQYWKVKNLYNPSFIAETNNIENVLLHRQQWVGMPGAPVTSIASFNMPFNFLGKKHGFGLMMVNDKIGLFSNTFTNLQYAYQFKFKKKGFLNVGLQGSMANLDFDASKIYIPGSDYHSKPEDDDALPTGSGGKVFDGGLGISWVTPKYYVAFSTNHLWNPTFKLSDDYDSYISRAYYLSGGYNIKLGSPLIELQPHTLIKYDAAAPLQVDVTAIMEYNKMFSGGLSWRKEDAIIILLGAKIKNIEAGYSYDITTSEISKVSSGSHELFLRYTIPIKKKKVFSGQKSVRIL